MVIDSTFVQMFITVVCAVLASSGLWTFLSKRTEKKDGKTRLLAGLAHDRILNLGQRYLDRGGITKEEYDDLHNYLYDPYEALGFNGSAKRMIVAIDHLKIISFEEAVELDKKNSQLTIIKDQIAKFHPEIK